MKKYTIKYERTILCQLNIMADNEDEARKAFDAMQFSSREISSGIFTPTGDELLSVTEAK